MSTVFSASMQVYQDCGKRASRQIARLDWSVPCPIKAGRVFENQTAFRCDLR
ncbi:MAG: hypothetical protein AAGU11_19830 [Syntrophobacteraceae bacterium]